MTEPQYEAYAAETMRLAALVDDCETPDDAWHTARERLRVLEALFDAHWKAVHAAQFAAIT